MKNNLTNILSKDKKNILLSLLNLQKSKNKTYLYKTDFVLENTGGIHNFNPILNTKERSSILEKHIIKNKNNENDKIEFLIYYKKSENKIILKVNEKEYKFTIEEWNNIAPDNYKLLILDEKKLYELKDIETGMDVPKEWENDYFKQNIKIGYVELIFTDKNRKEIKHKIWHYKTFLKINSLFSDIQKIRFYTEEEYFKFVNYKKAITNSLFITENKSLDFYKTTMLTIPVWDEKLFTTEKLGLSKEELKDLKTEWRRFWENRIFSYMFKDNKKTYFNNISEHLGIIQNYLEEKYLEQFYSNYSKYGKKKEEYKIGNGQYIIILEKEEEGKKEEKYFKVQILEKTKKNKKTKFKGYLDVKEIKDVKIENNKITYKEKMKETIAGKIYLEKISNKINISPKLEKQLELLLNKEKTELKNIYITNQNKMVVSLNNNKSFVIETNAVQELIGFNLKKDNKIIFKTKTQIVEKEKLITNLIINEDTIDIKQSVINFMMNKLNNGIKELSGIDIKEIIDDKSSLVFGSTETLTDILYLQFFNSLNSEYYKVINYSANEVLMASEIKENINKIKNKFKNNKIKKQIENINNLINKTTNIKNPLANIMLSGGIYSLNALLDELITKIEEINDKIQKPKEKIKEYIDSKKEEYETNIKENFFEIEEEIINKILNFIKFLKTSVKDFIEKIKKEGIKNVTLEFFSDLEKKLKEKFKEIWDKIPKNLQEIRNLLKNKLTELGKKLIYYFNEFLQKVTNSVFEKQMKHEIYSYLNKIEENEKENKDFVFKEKNQEQTNQKSEKYKKLKQIVRRLSTENISKEDKIKKLLKIRNAIILEKNTLKKNEIEELLKQINLEIEELKTITEMNTNKKLANIYNKTKKIHNSKITTPKYNNYSPNLS